MWKDIKTPLFTVLFIFLGFFLFTKIFGPIPFSVDSVTTNKQNLFTATGTADETAVPDTAKISLGVNKTSSTVGDAKNQVNATINKITDDLKNLGVSDKDIQTTNYSLNPNYDYSSGSQNNNGYSVSANIEVKLQSIEKANNAIDTATKDGATQVGSVQFILNDDEQKQLEDKARTEAIQKAKEKAQNIAQAAGIHLGRIVDVQESGENPKPLPFNEALDLKQTQTSPTELNPGQNKVTSTVTISYETY